jgi:hypothetical protein
MVSLIWYKSQVILAMDCCLATQTPPSQNYKFNRNFIVSLPNNGQTGTTVATGRDDWKYGK